MKYWNNNGKHQRELKFLTMKLVPGRNAADSDEGELLRLINSVYYDVGNNGGCNFNIDAGRFAHWCGLIYWLDRVDCRGLFMPKLRKWTPVVIERDECLTDRQMEELMALLDDVTDWVVEFAMKQTGGGMGVFLGAMGKAQQKRELAKAGLKPL